MYRLPIALLLAGAAATSAFAMPDQANQNRTDAQHNEVQRRHQGTASTHIRSTGGERRVVNKPVTPPVTTSTQTSPPELRRNVPVERVEHPRTTVAPQYEKRHVNRSINQIPNVDRVRPPVISRVPRIGTEPPLRAERSSRPRTQWNRDWRNNRQYDWSYWRQRNRSVFHLPRYRDPYGWAHRLFSIGWRLWPEYYGSSYWIDPSLYRLPPAPPGTRWIRYYNDALLVDMWTGEVIDVIPNFFW